MYSSGQSSTKAPRNPFSSKNVPSRASQPRPLLRKQQGINRSSKKWHDVFFNPLNVGVFLTACGLYMHAFDPFARPSWTHTSQTNILVTQALDTSVEVPAQESLKQKRLQQRKLNRQDLAKYRDESDPLLPYTSSPVDMHVQEQEVAADPVDEHYTETETEDPEEDMFEMAAFGEMVEKKPEEVLDPEEEKTPDESEKPEIHPLLQQTPEEIATRHKRFPSVTERAKVYMSNWYALPCEGNKDALVRYKRNAPGSWMIREPPNESERRLFVNATETVEMARIFSMTRDGIAECENNEYCVDAIDYWVPSYDRLEKNGLDMHVPLLSQFGDFSIAKSRIVDRPEVKITDLHANPPIPYIMKFRFRFKDDNAIQNMTSGCVEGQREIADAVDMPSQVGGVRYFQPIIWRLTSVRHVGMIGVIPSLDVPWERKKSAAVWRGALTGIFRDGFTLDMFDTKTDKELCMMMHRCKLSFLNHATPLVDAKMVLGNTKRTIPEVIDGVSVYGNKLNFDQMLAYKAIIMLEGNDISSGFKWALYSNSVVMTQHPTKTSWSMEELLVPWVHYIPLNDDLSDVQEKMQWVLDNDEEAKAIAHRGSLWIQDLLYHPQSERDDEDIYDEILRRYRQQFMEDNSLKGPKKRST